MRQSFNTLVSFIFDLVAPPRQSEALVRALTLESLVNLANLDGTLPYHNAQVRALVWELKYRGSGGAAELAGAYMSELLLAQAEGALGVPLVIPMPMHRERRRQRGHNQTEILCEAALKFLHGGFEYDPNNLERIKNTPPQQGLARHTRLKNVKGSMQVKNTERVRGRFCLVVDDVTTTGASFAEAKRALKAAGARAVECVALAQS